MASFVSYADEIGDRLFKYNYERIAYDSLQLLE